MAIFPYQYSNINGIPSLEVRRIVVSDTSVDFVFRPDWDRNPSRGILFIYVPDAIPDGTTGTLPIRFTMAGNVQNVTVAGGANLTVADFAGAGYYLVAYDRNAGALQLIG
jgi:hypothetical protein